MCSGKVRYRDEKEAKHAKRKYEALRSVPLRIYECALCAGYHLTRAGVLDRRVG